MIEITPDNLEKRAKQLYKYQRIFPAEIPTLLAESGRKLREYREKSEFWLSIERKIRSLAVQMGVPRGNVYGDGHGNPNIDDVLEEMFHASQQ